MGSPRVSRLERLSVVHNVAYSSDSLQSAMRKQHLYVYTRTAICPSTACLHG